MMHSQKYNVGIEERPVAPYRFGRSWMQPSLPMLKNLDLMPGSEETREQFITIDDLIGKARELLLAVPL